MLKKYVRRVRILAGLLLSVAALSAQYTVTGGAGTPLLAEDASKTYDLWVYMVYGMQNVEISYTSSSSDHRWFRYKTSALEAEEISSVQNGTTSYIRNVEDGCGYFVEEPGKISKYIWIIDYSRHVFDVSALRVSESGDPCSNLQLEGEAVVGGLSYYPPRGNQAIPLTRQVRLLYRTLEWQDEARTFVEKEQEEEKELTVSGNGGSFRISVSAPLCDTQITLNGDQFARHFGVEKTIHTDEYKAVAVEVHADTTLVENDAPNMKQGDEGYSAPVSITFTARANDPVASLYNWKIYRTEENGEENPLVLFTGDEVEYTFNHAGSFKARVEVSDRTGTCSTSEEFDIQVSESFLDVPNVFSPGMTPGVNDEFRVAYKSLVRFNAWIFNRWGQELFHWTDPAKGWDGKKGGKYMPPGVYYYVIEAEGSDGRKYKKAGDVNILRSKTIQNEMIER